MLGYHFTSYKLSNGDPIPPIGKWLVYDGPIVPCESGLHASEHPYDALQYAPGKLLHRAELEGDLLAYGKPIDRLVGRRRKILATIDAESLLRKFACQCALDVTHLWTPPPPPVVTYYLASLIQSVRATVRAELEAYKAAAWSAAREANWDVGKGADWGVAGEAAEPDTPVARQARSMAGAAAYYAIDTAAAWEAAREANFLSAI
jgi:hypothetical protein